ncbi:MAG: hypothetical protein Ct9H90mP13_04610 [Pseudomonadota bacterium]|nr:MAG: hypothetical protein Ct9H90mP13_04610 [Pseudomonadota bacterium]
MKKDDILKSIDGIEIQNIEQFSQLIMDRPNALIDLLIERDGMDYETDVSLTTREDNKSMGYIGLQTTLIKINCKNNGYRKVFFYSKFPHVN